MSCMSIGATLMKAVYWLFWFCLAQELVVISIFPQAHLEVVLTFLMSMGIFLTLFGVVMVCRVRYAIFGKCLNPPFDYLLEGNSNFFYSHMSPPGSNLSQSSSVDSFEEQHEV